MGKNTVDADPATDIKDRMKGLDEIYKDAHDN